MDTLCEFNNPACHGAKELQLLLEISSFLSNKVVNLDEVIEILAKHLEAERIYLQFSIVKRYQ